MHRRIFAAATAIVLSFTLFTACNGDKAENTTDAPSTSEAAQSEKNPIIEAEEQLSMVDAANAAGTLSAFEKVLASKEAHIAAYNGPDDIILSSENHIEKTVSVKTTGKTELNSTIDTLIIKQSPMGLTVNARAESIIVDGNAVTVDILSDTGSIYIVGKEVKLHIRNGKTDNITVRNTTTVIYNHTDEDITVTLANGSTRTLKKNHTYQVKEDLMTKGTSES